MEEPKETKCQRPVRGSKMGESWENEPKARGWLEEPNWENQGKTEGQRAIRGTKMGEPRENQRPEASWRDQHGSTKGEPKAMRGAIAEQNWENQGRTKCQRPVRWTKVGEPRENQRPEAG